MQCLNAAIPIDVTLLGTVIVVKPLQSLKAPSPIVIMLFAIVTLDKLLHPLKQLSPIVFAQFPNSACIALVVVIFPDVTELVLSQGYSVVEPPEYDILTFPVNG